MSISDRRLRWARKTIGYRPSPAKAGAPYYASTVRLSRGSTRLGGPERLSRCSLPTYFAGERGGRMARRHRSVAVATGQNHLCAEVPAVAAAPPLPAAHSRPCGCGNGIGCGTRNAWHSGTSSPGSNASRSFSVPQTDQRRLRKNRISRTAEGSTGRTRAFACATKSACSGPVIAGVPAGGSDMPGCRISAGRWRVGMLAAGLLHRCRGRSPVRAPGRLLARGRRQTCV